MTNIAPAAMPERKIIGVHRLRAESNNVTNNVVDTPIKATSLTVICQYPFVAVEPVQDFLQPVG